MGARHSSLIVGAVSAAALLGSPAWAQWTVYDPANHIQNIYQAVRSLQEVNQQIQQLAHEIAMLENMARDLEALPASVARDIQGRLQRIEGLMRQAEGIGFRVEEIDRAYAAHYPETYDTAPRQAELVAQARARWLQSRSAFQDSLRVTAQVVSSAGADAQSLDRLIGTSQAAAGNLQVAQAGNQIAALQAEQLMQIEAMLAAQHRAEALEQARALAEAERGRARTRAFLGGEGR